MNGNILTRLEKLECTMGSIETEGLTVFIRTVAADNGKPAAIQPEPVDAKMMGRDWKLSREFDESVDKFMARAGKAVPRGSDGVAVILLTYMDDGTHQHQ